MPDGTLNLARGTARRSAAARPRSLDASMIVQPADQWGPKLVGEALIAALTWTRRLAGRVGPAGMVAARIATSPLTLDDFLAEGWGLPECADDEEQAPKQMVVMPSPLTVTRHLAALEWPAVYLCPTHVGSARMLGLWAACKAHRRAFSVAVQGRGVHRSLAYQLRDRGLSMIAQGLERDGVPLASLGR